MGERQRVASPATATAPELVLADEPTALLDEANAIALSRLLARLAEDRVNTVFVTTHDPLLLDVADEILEL